jgi:hypothetical protein
MAFGSIATMNLAGLGFVRRPRLTARVLRGLDCALALAEADMQAYQSDPVPMYSDKQAEDFYRARAYVQELIRWHKLAKAKTSNAGAWSKGTKKVGVRK